MQSSDSFYGFGYTFWTFWIIALHLLYKLWISNILTTSITEETCIVEMRIWCKKIGTVNSITTTGSMPLLVDVSSPRVTTAQEFALRCWHEYQLNGHFYKYRVTKG